MRLEDLTVTLRPRQPWEAVDLGCSLVRRDYGRLLLLWLITVVPVWGLITALMWNHPLWFTLVIWWLKPLYDRVPLFYLSRATFGSRPTLKETLKAWPSLWSRFLLSALILRRFSLIRSFALPVWMLEGQRGKAVTQRLKALTTTKGSGGSTQTLVFLKLELAVYLGLIMLTSSFGPSSTQIDLIDLLFNQTAILEDNHALLWFYNILYLFAVTLIEPFYVGAGFGLYLNARTHLEGWDIELTFRRMAQRLRAAAGIVILSLGMWLPQNIQAQTESVPRTEVQEAIAEIYAQPEFKEHSKTIRKWVPEFSESSPPSPDAPGWIREILTVLGYACLALAVFWLIRWLILNKHLLKLRWASSSVDQKISTPRVIMGLDIARESLPSNIVAAARAAWAEGHHHEALSLLYRGALSRLVEFKRLPIHDSDTEDDCLLKVSHLGDETITLFFRQLTMLWVGAAYASEVPSESAFQQLCADWPFDLNVNAAPKKPRSLVPAAILLFILPWLASCGKGEWVDDTIELGYRGEARINPFLAAQQFLQKFGHECERKASLKKLPNSYKSVLFVSAESGISEAQAQQLLQWVSDGGHVVYLISGAGHYNDWGVMSALSFLKYAGSGDQVEPVLNALDVNVEGLKDLFASEKKLRRKLRGEKVEPSEETTTPEEKEEAEEAENPPLKVDEIITRQGEIQMGSTTFKVDFPEFIKLSLKRPLRVGEYQSGSQDSTPMLSLKKGLGRVTLIAHARPLRNRYLDEKDHASWLLSMVGRTPQNVYFVTTTQKGFWDLLWERAWMPLIGLGLVTLIWLWMHLPRFGPLKRIELHETKHFVEHIGALGQFFYRLNRSDILLTAAADAVRVRAFKKHPHLINQNHDSLVKVLADLSPLPPAQIFAALEPPVGKIASVELARRLNDLKVLRDSLA